MSAATDSLTEKSTTPMVSARQPVAAPAATGVAVVLAVVLIGVGVVAVRDVLVSVGVITGAPWIVSVLNRLDGLTAQGWMLPAGVAVTVLGVLLVFTAVKPRRRSHLPLSASDTWITARDITRLTQSSVQALTGVAAATVGGSERRKLKLAVIALAGYDSSAVQAAAHAAATEVVAELARPPRVRVRIKELERR